MITISDTAKKLKTIGLSRDESLVYGYLLDHGQSKSITIQKGTGLTKPLVYRALGELSEKSLVEVTKKPGSISEYSATDPRNIEQKFDDDLQKIEQNKALFASMAPELMSQYLSHIDRPVIRYGEGLPGLRTLYREINQTRQDILLFQSPFDSTLPHIHEVVQDQIKEQIHLGIHVRAITSLVPETQKWYTKYDKKNLVERRIVPEELMKIPSQIIVFGNSVGISSVIEPFITTIIEDEHIANTFRIMFESLWSLSEHHHNAIVKSFDPSVSLPAETSQPPEQSSPPPESSQ